MARLYVALSLLLLPLASAQDAASSTASATSKSKSGTHTGTHAHTGPFSAFTKSLPQEKKKPFMELMKRLRGAKAATVGTKEEKKKVMGALDSDIHKLLGTEYKRYRTVQHAQHEMHTTLKKGTPPASTLASTAPPPPAAAAAGGKKKAAGLPGGALKKKKASTTVG